MSFTESVSIDDLIERPGTAVVVAICVLVLFGWRKHARAAPKAPRDPARSPRGFSVTQHDTLEYRPVGIIRRTVAFATSGAIAVIIGIIAAVVIAGAIAVTVIVLTNMLQ